MAGVNSMIQGLKFNIITCSNLENNSKDCVDINSADNYDDDDDSHKKSNRVFCSYCHSLL